MSGAKVVLVWPRIAALFQDEGNRFITNLSESAALNEDTKYPELLAQLLADCDEIIECDGLNHGESMLIASEMLVQARGPSGLTVGREEAAIVLKPEIATDRILKKGTMTSMQRLSDASLPGDPGRRDDA